MDRPLRLIPTDPPRAAKGGPVSLPGGGGGGGDTTKRTTPTPPPPSRRGPPSGVVVAWRGWLACPPPASSLRQLARTLEALLVVASVPLSVEELAEAADDDPEQVEDALRLVGERFAEERSGIVLEHVAGGWAFRAAREEAAACARLFERPAQRNLSQAALETLAIVAYLGPCTRPDIARIRGVAADSAVANLLERGLIAEAGRDHGAGGAVRYRTTSLFERVFGLESLSELPRLDDVGTDAAEIRDRLHTVAERRSA